MDETDPIIHLPTPGDHYSPATGSAIMTVIYELSRRHAKANGNTKIIVGMGTRHDYSVGECIEAPLGGLPDRNHKIADALFGRFGLERRFMVDAYRPAYNTISSTFNGALVAHNAPAVLPGLKKAAPGSRTGLYCQNLLFSTYPNHETRRILRSADTVICVSEYLAGDLRMRLGSADCNIHIIHNGVDIDRFRPADTPPGGDVPIILFVGRVIPVKGVDLLIKAAVKIANGKRRFKLRIVGSSGFTSNDPLSGYEQELRQIAAAIPEYIEFLPFVDRNNVVEQYQAASIFSVPSNWDDPCPLTMTEALACGLPIVASRRGGIPEEGGDAALYFAPPNTDELAQQLEFLIDDTAARAELGRKARRRAEALCWENQYRLFRKAMFD